ncbi:MAG TPA: ABC transporter ATP-binding protein [Planctomycetota bacterium]|nr:ABC transporter ATP-binding protein [Planctomycetota bacterium]HRR81444.1 ABC transporter ATP-binding protein [Planctomycetota bacterium]HRT96740.1 ABC transporter ATP-binding protein [Planctomycetota bacterium]
MLQVTDLVAHYGGFSLQRISVTIPQGESFVLLGPSGAGKTLFLETVLGVKPPDAGRILLDGRDIGRTRPEERGFCYLPQDLALFPHLSVRENIAFGLAVRRVGGAAAEERVRGAVRLLGIERLLGRRDIRSLSGGEKQRVALARALVVEPRVLFLDEPFSALDPATRRQLQREFRDIWRRLGLTAILVTHDQDEAAALADRLAVLMDGRLKQCAAPGEVFERPADLATAQFLLIENIFPGRLLSGSPASGFGAVECGPVRFRVVLREPLGDAAAVHVGIRGCHVKLHPRGTPPANASVYPGVLEGFTPSASAPRALVRLAEGVRIECGPWPDPQALPTPVGGELLVELPPERCLVFRDTEQREG